MVHLKDSKNTSDTLGKAYESRDKELKLACCYLLSYYLRVYRYNIYSTKLLESC